MDQGPQLTNSACFSPALSAGGMIGAHAPQVERDPGDVIGYWLRRAEQESIAAIRSIDARASVRHHQMASVYSERAQALLAERPYAL